MNDIDNIIADLDGECSIQDDSDGQITSDTKEVSSEPKGNSEQTSPSNKLYPGDVQDTSKPLKESYQCLEYPDPASVVEFFDDSVNGGFVTLYPWQVNISTILAASKATAQHPCKFCLVANNGSGKDLFIIAPFSIWFALTKVKSRVIITSSSGVQLTSQTESYIKSLAEKVNKYFGAEIFLIRQRFIKCLLSGSEIRMFATDEAGKAEGYHPIEPNREMAIIVNEAKSVSEEIHAALRRCTGYNYWLEISSTGEPKGFFYRAFCEWPHTMRVTSYECPHISKDEIEKDKIDLGENSALFRSIHLALFTTIGGETIISADHIDDLLKNPPDNNTTISGTRVGIDLAAGGDENVIVIFDGNKFRCEHFFREVDTTITADNIDRILRKEKISQTNDFTYADDGGVGHSTIDMLCNKGWNIKRIRNEWQAFNKRQYGNRGAENWYRVSRLIEEHLIDLTNISDKLKEQLGSRKYKKVATSGRIFLESKKDAKAHGHPSPDRADALILALTGIVVGDILKSPAPTDEKPRIKLATKEDIEQYIDNRTYGVFEEKHNSKRIYGSLHTVMSN